MERAVLQGFLAEGLSLEQIGKRVGRDPSTVGYWVQKHGLRAVNSERHAARGGIARADLEALVNDGGSIAQIASSLGVSHGTVRHWLKRYELRTRGSAGRRSRVAPDDAKLAGLTVVRSVCRRHGETDFVLEGRGYYRCRRCRSRYVARRRRAIKQSLIVEAGGRCQACGYARYFGALEFHHLDPQTKTFDLSRGAASFDRMREEASKCQLLCANCHAETEHGLEIRSPALEGLFTSKPARGRVAGAGGPLDVLGDCPRHGRTLLYRDGRGSKRCKRCRAEAVVRWRKRAKALVVRECGGRCAICAYDRCIGALQFHHVDPATKVFGLSDGGVARSLDRIRAEVGKCVLLCSNCHAEVEGGVTQLQPH